MLLDKMDVNIVKKLKWEHALSPNGVDLGGEWRRGEDQSEGESDLACATATQGSALKARSLTPWLRFTSR